MNAPADPQKLRRQLSRAFLLVGIALVFFAGFLSGTSYELGRHKLNLGDFWTAYNLIESRYVGEIDKQKAVQGSISGLVESLDDPYSAFLTETERSQLDNELKGEFEGIGAELALKDEAITVVAPLSGSPAEKAGLKSNDVIVKIDDVDAQTLTLDQAVAKIRGPKGTQVTLTVIREGNDETIELKITREKIQVDSVKWKMIGTIGYLEISQFGDDTVRLSREAAEELKAKNPTAIILDVRNNPGGYLDDVPPIAGLFLPPSVITIQKLKDGRKEPLRSAEIPVIPSTPLFVLTNGGSASAAEILAGALQDYGRAKLVGAKTFGKGSVQDLIPLSSGSALRLTIAEWLTPKERSINKTGIEPDIKVEGEKTAEADPVLDKALELARQ